MRVYDRDLIRGGHYGQRSCEPHLQAEHMAAPTNAAKREESSCQLGAVHTWALFGHGAMSDLSPECAPKRTSADHCEFMGSRRSATPDIPAICAPCRRTHRAVLDRKS